MSSSRIVKINNQLSQDINISINLNDTNDIPIQVTQKKPFNVKQILRDYMIDRIKKMKAQDARYENDSHGETISLNSELELKLMEDTIDGLRKIIIPVIICMTLVILLISNVSFYTANDGVYLIYAPFHEEGNISSGVKIGQAIANSLIILAIVIVSTCIMVALMYYQCYKVISIWLYLVTISILFTFSFSIFYQFLDVFNLGMDIISFTLIVLNFGTLGFLSIHFKSPLLVQQSYLLITSVFMALIFIKYLPNWTTWVFLSVIALYDIFAVLCPMGPLRLMLNVAKRDKVPIFASLIYSSMAWVEPKKDEEELEVLSEDDKSTNNQVEEIEEEIQQTPEDHESAVSSISENLEISGLKLGLGDFVFYSVLVGKAASSGDYNTVFACLISIICGLTITLFILTASRNALPALPFSIALGLIFFFSTFYSLTPMMNYMTHEQIFL